MTDQQGENPTEPTPEGSATPPPAPPPPPADAPAAPAAPAAHASSAPTYDLNDAKATLQGAHKFDIAIMAAGIVAFLAGFMPFYTISGTFGGSASWSAWHGFFGWFAVLVALAGAVAVALALFNVVALPMPVHQIAAGAFALALVCLILALFINPLPNCGGACSDGHGFGYWLALILVLAGLVVSVLRMRETDAKSA